MDQKEINDTEWRNPENWSGSLLGFYFSKKDSRTWVPKSVPQMGWTLNLGKPAGARWLFFLLAGVPIIIAAIIVAVLVKQL